MDRRRYQNGINSIYKNPQKFNCIKNTRCKILKGVLAGIGDEAVAGIITAMIQYCKVRSPVQ